MYFRSDGVDFAFEECGGGDGTSRFSSVVISEKEEEGQSIKNWSVTFSV